MPRRRSGFTFVELLIVVVILGILAAIALPRLSGTKDKAKLAALRSDVSNAKIAEESYYVVYGVYATFTQLQTDNLLSLSPNSTVVVAASPAGYKVIATDNTISSSIKSCGVRVGAGAAMAVDGVISCP